MAYERSSDTKVRGDSLDAFVKNMSDSYVRQLQVRNIADEEKFNTLVLEQNLPLADQLEYRKEQLTRVADDPTEKARIKGEISALKNRIEQEKFANDYLEKLISFESGISSLDSVISWLEATKASTTDETIKNEINKQLVEKQREKFTQTQNLIKSQTEYAVNDKSKGVLEDQIKNVNKARTKAVLAGNEEMVAVFDLQLQSLNKAKTESEIEKTMKDFAVSTITGYSSASNLLDEYGKKIASASTSGPVTVGGVTYANAREFWTFKRDSYVSDQSSAGFFGRLGSEYENKIAVASSKNALTPDMLRNYASEIDKLKGRAELNGYDINIDTLRQGTLQSGSDTLTDKITNRYAVDYDLGKAVGELNVLKSLGVNTDSAYAKIITTGSQIKQNQIDSILTAAQNAMKNDPNLTPEQAIQTAVAAGAGAVLSPEDLTKKNETDITKDLAKGAQDESFTNDPRLTINQQDPNAVPGAAPATTPTNTQPSTYQGGSIVDFLRSTGKDSSFSARAKLAAEQGITNYTGSAQQNTTLLEKLRTNTPAPQPQAQPTQPKTTPKTNPAPAPTPTPQTKPASTQTPQQPKPQYQGGSVVDYFRSVGQDSSFTARSKVAKEKGITNYTGTAEQNKQLLKALRGF